jgi:predicted nucleic acid-binding protein
MRYCKREGIKVHGTVLVLALAVKGKILTLDQAENILNEMKEKGYSLDDQIDVRGALGSKK